jgi:hypothetical protein
MRAPAVPLGIVEVQRLVGAVVRGAVDAPAPIQQAREGGRQVAARRVVDREVVQAGGAGGRGRATPTLPGVQADVVVIATGREKGRGAHVEEQIETQQVAIEADRPPKIGDPEMHMPDAGFCWDGTMGHRNLQIESAALIPTATRCKRQSTSCTPQRETANYNLGTVAGGKLVCIQYNALRATLANTIAHYCWMLSLPNRVTILIRNAFNEHEGESSSPPPALMACCISGGPSGSGWRPHAAPAV